MFTEEKLQRIICDDDGTYKYILRLQNVGPRIPALLFDVYAPTKEYALTRGIATVRVIQRALKSAGVSYAKADPGHGLGHVMRDYVNALRLFTHMDIDPKTVFVSFVAGVLHVSACTYMYRYDEEKNVAGHAGIAARVIDAIMQEDEFFDDFSFAERALIQYGIAAHTQYLKPRIIQGKTLQPWIDCDENGKPYLPVWLPRWVDRLDCHGPSDIAREYLVMRLPIEKNMTTLLRNAEGIALDRYGKNLLETMYAFRDSQTNASPYGKFDFGWMCEERDYLTSHFDYIFQSRKWTGECRKLHAPYMSLARQDTVARAWEDFLSYTIEPHPAVGRMQANHLRVMMQLLSPQNRCFWLEAFEQTMRSYGAWAYRAIADLNRLPVEWMKFLGFDDVRHVIAPHPSWVSV